ncbi:hypothetical protein B6N60_01499 [Richelia sinica FACHB-800]|uniref:Uncharacterized protein n=1 Tax=Richelia sinica FACHB-800 TaxID=1357546 RepID=A0A975Y450_9NOST|nr:hypothetical protein [Richelia sinica]MBD2663629.1 hypothetical protein [Richelia sinica FACHB-800]QXE22813.1 hypothetical protein B6N60_01499 [Richelia sinica FACHB-800]
MSQVNHKISLLELIQIFTEFRQNIIINIKHLEENYQRTGIKRVKGVRDENGRIIQPCLRTESVYPGDYVGMGIFAFNRNQATINLLVKRKVKLVKTEDNTPILEVAGLLTNDLDAYNNYTIVWDGKIHVKWLQIKISSKNLFNLLKSSGVIDDDNFDFHHEYIINLDQLPLVPEKFSFTSIDSLFNELAEVKVLTSILSACLRNESNVFISEQLDELRKHYLSKNLFLNFPTTDLKSSEFDYHVSYKIDIGNLDILNLYKLYSANKFLARRYQAYDQDTGEIFLKPNLEMLLSENIIFQPKAISSRMKITKVDDLMKPIFDDFLGIEHNGKIKVILDKVGANSLANMLPVKHVEHLVDKSEIIAIMVTAISKLEQFADKIYQENISPLVFYIGATGLLPDEISSTAISSEELMANYPNLQVSKYEQNGVFFLVGNSIISVYGKQKKYSKQLVMAA